MTDSRIPDVYQHPDGRIAIDRRPGNYGVLVTDASGWVTPEVHLSVPAGFVRLVPETEAGAFVGDDPALAAYRAEAREAWDAARRVIPKAPYKAASIAEVIDTLGQQIAEKHWKMSNSGLAYSELWRAIETHPGVCGVRMVWEDDPLSPTGRRPRAEIESCAPDTADESPAECAEDVQEIAAILDAEVGISGESVVERVREALRTDKYSNLNQRALAWDAVAGHPLIGPLSMLPEGNSYAQQVRAKLDEIAATQMPVRGLDPSNPDDIRAVEAFLGWYLTHGKLDVDFDTPAFEAIQETRRHLDRDADRVAGNALRARKIAAMAQAIHRADTSSEIRDDYDRLADASLAALEAMEDERTTEATQPGPHLQHRRR